MSVKIIELLESLGELLDEVAMNPASLKKMAAQTGAQAGMEFEMVVPVSTTDEDDITEPDYTDDPRPNDFQDIEDFFGDGEWNGWRDIQRLMSDIKSDYFDWVNDELYKIWTANKQNESKEYFDEFIKDSYSGPEEELEQWLHDQWDEKSDYYDQAYQAWLEEQMQSGDLPSEEDFLRNEGVDSMSDVVDHYNITWPFYYTSEAGSNEEVLEDIANSFASAVGRRVNVSTSYHGADRSPDEYALEPDSSIKAEDSDHSGLEFVSPPMPVDQMLSELKQVINWAKKTGCYTNISTGLHMNVSVPNFSEKNLDYVKLVLLLGDQYVLGMYGREANTYAKSSLELLQQRIVTLRHYTPNDMANALYLVRQGLGQVASKYIHSGYTTKYVSVNIHDDYIEFRSPGGDWLNVDYPHLESTLLRFVVALDAACDPNKYRQEYLKKLYKLLQPTSRTDAIAMFAQYVAGTLPKAALKNMIRNIQVRRNPLTNKWYLWEISSENYGAEIVIAKTEEEAKQKAKEKNPALDERFGVDLTARIIRRYDPSDEDEPKI